jgi:uncharacterized oligopeptide transporter (OPT) family protein
VSIVRALRALTWKHWACATALSIALAMAMPLQDFPRNSYWVLWQFLFSVPWYLLYGYTLLVAIVIAESSAAPGRSTPAWRYVVALLAAGAMYVAALATFPELYQLAPREIRSGKEFTPLGLGSERRQHVLRGAPTRLAYGWFLTFIYVRLRNARLAARALADAEIERSEAQRRLLAAQLVAAHAQVDPAFVLQKLEEVERAYEADPAGADILLDEFIAFLRDAIPRLRAEGAA